MCRCKVLASLKIKYHNMKLSHLVSCFATMVYSIVNSNAESLIGLFIENILRDNNLKVFFISDFKTKFSRELISFVSYQYYDGIEVLKLESNTQINQQGCSDHLEYERRTGNLLVLISLTNSNLKKGINYLNSTILDCPLRFNAGLFHTRNTILFVIPEEEKSSIGSIFQLKMMQIHKRAAILQYSSESLTLQRYNICNQALKVLKNFTKLELKSDYPSQLAILFPSYNMNGCKFKVSILPVGYIVGADEISNPRQVSLLNIKLKH